MSGGNPSSKQKTCIWMPTLKRPIKWVANCGVDYKHAQHDFKFCPYCGNPIEATL